MVSDEAQEILDDVQREGGSVVFLHFRDNRDQLWVASAVVSPLARRGGEERLALDSTEGQGLLLVGIETMVE